MKDLSVTKAVTFWLDYHRTNSKEATVKSYSTILNKFSLEFEGQNLYDLTSEEILSFLNRATENRKPQTKSTRFAHLSSFFNFILNNIDPDFRNPCNSPMMRKQFRAKAPTQWDIIEKEIVDEVIFRTQNTRNRLLLELMARGGMRIGEVLKLTPDDIKDEKLALRDPKSGKEIEYVFIPKKIADKLKEYIWKKNILPSQRIFPIGYEAARAVVKKAGKIVGIKLKPHDLRRHAATFASRSGVPVEIVSKVILRHSNLSTTKSFNCIPAKFWQQNLPDNPSVSSIQKYRV